jgi:hypothetical protein
MKQLLSLFLFLLPCLALAQYPSNGNQKITLGEQTTADGLIYRGVAADTTLTAKSDTAAYFVLDTVNINLYTYKASATGRKWRQLGADTAAIAYVNTYGTQTVNGAKTFTSTVTGARFDPTSSSASGNGMFLPAINTLGFSTNNTNKFFISSIGNLSTDSLSKTTATYKTFELGKGSGTTVMAGRLDGYNEFILGLNFYYDGGANLKYIGNSYSTYYQQTDGKHAFYRAATGTAGANITFKESVRITDNGSLYIFGNNLPLVISSSSSNTLYTTYQYNTNTDVGYIGNGVGTVTGGGAGDFGVTAASGNLLFASGGVTERMRISSAGEVNIGYGSTDNGAYKLQVNSQIFATNATIETSDIRFKENIKPLDKGLEIINKLKPVKFNFITTTENNFSEFDEIGFIAQDVEGALSTELFAKAVVKKLDEDKEDSALGLMTEKFIPILVKAIQEQQALIKVLEQRIINLENK